MVCTRLPCVYGRARNFGENWKFLRNDECNPCGVPGRMKTSEIVEESRFDCTWTRRGVNYGEDIFFFPSVFVIHLSYGCILARGHDGKKRSFITSHPGLAENADELTATACVIFFFSFARVIALSFTADT